MKWLLPLFSLLFPSLLYSQENNSDYVIDFITTREGLSHNYVSGVVSDDLNTKWIGTENGITKFNGYDFEYIKPNEEFKDLLNENIEVLFVDQASNLWIGTKSGGLSYLDIKNNAVKNYNHLIDLANEGDLRVTSLSQDAKGNIWIGTWRDGVFVIDYKNEKLLRHFDSNNAVYSIEEDFNKAIWFCSGRKLSRFDTEKEKLTEFTIEAGLLTDILPDKIRNKVWIAASGTNTKLYHFDYNTDALGFIETKVPSNFSRKLSLDRYNHIWIGTWGKGVYRSDRDLNTFSRIELTTNNSERLSGNYNTIIDIHRDENNAMWLSTTNAGVVKLIESSGFQNIEKQITNLKLKGFLNCTSFYKDDENIFVGTFDGVYHGKDFANLTLISAVGNVKISALHRYGDNLYIGTADRFHIYNLSKKAVAFTSERPYKITSILIDNETVYLGTQQLGLAIVGLKNIEDETKYIFYSENRSDSRKIESDRITSIKKDSNNNIWIGTYNGLHLFNSAKRTFIHQSDLLKEKLPSVIINSFDIIGNRLWLATPNGLVKLLYQGSSLKIEKIITQQNGLNSNFICSVTFDKNSNLWLSTLTEIVKYNDVDESIISYGNTSGIRSTSFNNNSFYNYKGNEIYFGGIDNVTYFKPADIKDFNVIPEVIFTTLRVNNEIIQYKPGSKILDKNFDYAESIKLTHKQNFFSAGFVANDYLGKLNIKYRYLLEGYQDQWIDLQDKNEINFAGLSPGKYTLKVKASRDNQNWSEPKSLKIHLQGSPWLSPLALFLYFTIASTIIIILVRSNNNRLRLENNLEIARIDKEKEIELTEAKLNFFTNISHEFRTPLTLIIGPLQELLDTDNIPHKVHKNLSFIDRNTNRLLNLINQLLDFRKADHGLLTLNVSNGNFVRFSSEVHLYFKAATKAKNIQYRFKSSREEIVFPFDRNKMEIVLCNLLSNAIKYTNAGDEILMEVESDSNFCIITIKDTGIGMKPEEAERIFDRFYQIKSASTASLVGSGIGLSFSKQITELHHGSIGVQSKLNEGTVFTIKLSMNPDLYEAEIDKGYITTDNIKGYNTEDVVYITENLNISAKEHSVLIIDDNPEILGYLKNILSDTYEVIEATNGEEGFEKASQKIPDLIVSDVMMPLKDGITLCKELKNQITTSHIPIILLTARTSTVFEIEGLKTGADHYVTKPFNSKVIKARISGLLENREKLRSHFLNKVRFLPTAKEIENDTDTENAFIHKAILLVEKNLQNPDFGIETLVDELYMSQSTLYRKVKSLTGLSLTAFIRSVRLKKSAELILSSELNLSQIAYEVGFNDYKYFKTSFKKQFDCVPSQYKAIAVPN